jgi:hypothetical protein
MFAAETKLESATKAFAFVSVGNPSVAPVKRTDGSARWQLTQSMVFAEWTLGLAMRNAASTAFCWAA